MTIFDSQDPLSDANTEYNLMAAYYRDIGSHNFLTAEEEQAHSKIIQQGFSEIIHVLCEKYSKIEQLSNLRKKIAIWKTSDKSFKPKQLILNEIRQDVANISKSLPAGGEIKKLQSDLEVQYQKIDTAKNIMIRANLPLVIATAKRYTQTQFPLNDLIQEGNLGLMRAVLRFDYAKGFRFSTYALWWIKQSISKAVVDKGKEIRVPYHFNELSKKYFKVFHTQKEVLGRAPTLHEMSQATKIPINKILLIIESANEPLSLETPVGNDNGTLVQFLENETAESPYHQTFLKERLHKLHDSLSVLTERQRDVVCLRFGLEGQGECTLQEIGDKFQVTRECIRQTEMRALRRLRMSVHTNGMRAYCAV